MPFGILCISIILNKRRCNRRSTFQKSGTSNQPKNKPRKRLPRAVIVSPFFPLFLVMENSIRLALCKKISAKFGKEPQNHKDICELYYEMPEIGISTLKRIFGKQGHCDCENMCSRKAPQKALCTYLGYDSWDVLVAELEFEANPTKVAKELAALRKRK